MNQIRLGLPKGSLNTKGRGNTQEVLVDAGYDIRGYEPGNESVSELTIVNDPEIIAFLTRPQSAPVELSREMLDIAIIGDDWVKEEGVNTDGDGIRKVGDLEYGQTRLVMAVPDDKTFESLSDFFQALRGRGKPILCFTEYVNLTRQRFMENSAYQEIYGDSKPLVQIRGLVDGENRDVQIINSDGVTEGYPAKGADIIVDNTQSGRTLQEYNLRELEQMMETSTGLYAGPSCIDWEGKKAEEIFEQLHGAVVGKRYFDVKFNVPNPIVENLRGYLIANGLCADEPSIIVGENYSAVNILIPRERFPQVLRTLRQDYSASAICFDSNRAFIE
jgi:ATP phosphoribosyltransferase